MRSKAAVWLMRDVVMKMLITKIEVLTSGKNGGKAKWRAPRHKQEKRGNSGAYQKELTKLAVSRSNHAWQHGSLNCWAVLKVLKKKKETRSLHVGS